LALLHAGILQLVVNAESFVLGFLIGLIVGLANDPQAFMTVFYISQSLVGTLVEVAVFAYYGTRVAPTIMWRHLAAVALLTAPLQLLVNFVLALALEPSKAFSVLLPASIVVAFIQTFVAMGIGGAIAGWLRPKRPTYPYGYGGYGAPPIPPAQAQPPYAYRPPAVYPPNQAAPTPWQSGQPPAGPAPFPWPAPPMQSPQPQPGQPGYPPAQQPPYPPSSGPQGPTRPDSYPPPGAPRQP
jgi:hypothetical protein